MYQMSECEQSPDNVFVDLFGKYFHWSLTNLECPLMPWINLNPNPGSKILLCREPKTKYCSNITHWLPTNQHETKPKFPLPSVVVVGKCFVPEPQVYSLFVASSDIIHQFTCIQWFKQMLQFGIIDLKMKGNYH